MKIYKLLCMTVLISFWLVSIVCAERVVREPVGDTGHYIVHDSDSARIEDANGKVLYQGYADSSDGSYEEITVLDTKPELYSTFIDSHGPDITKILYVSDDGIKQLFSDYDRRPYYVKFGDYGIFADSHGDPTDASVTKYYNSDGTPITDLEAFLKEKGLNISDGKFSDGKPFISTEEQKQISDDAWQTSLPAPFLTKKQVLPFCFFLVLLFAVIFLKAFFGK